MDGKEIWKGKDIFSLSLPDGLNIIFRSSICQQCDNCKKENCDIDAYVKVKAGKLLSGTIDEKGVGAFKGKILDKIARDYGTDAARIFIETSSKMALATIMISGFSTSIDDEDIPNDAKIQIQEMLKQSVEKVGGYVEAYREGTLEAMPGRSCAMS